MSTVYEIDAATGEAFERPATADELAMIETVRESAAQAEQARADAAAAKASARAKLKALGLTDDEIAALIP